MRASLPILATSLAASLLGLSTCAEAQNGAGENARAVEMVRRQLEARDVREPRVLAAMRRVPRHRFVPASQRPYAYDDRPLPIGHEQTISQPYIVGLMTQLAELEPGDRVLEIGTGSGYQAAVLAELEVDVYSIEIVRPLGERARGVLRELGYDRVHVRIGDGYQGWPEHAPFDAVILTAAPPRIPDPLLEQLAVGGRLVAPVGRGVQDLVVVIRTEEGYASRRVIPVRFVPMTGEAQRR
ncbi:MAG: protein-L-isoaspartate(D-aspartate) O-methyltransferase [Sandaracinaceae bacterium]